MTSTEAAPRHTILVGVDGSESSNGALRWATRQATLTDASLEVIMTWEWPSSYGWSFPLPAEYDPAADAQRLLDGVIAELRESHPNLDIRPRVVEGHPAPTLVEASRGADLLVVGSRGHGEFAGMLLGSVSEFLTTHSRCPVVVIRHGADSRRDD